MLINAYQLSEMFKAQEELNKKFNGENWRRGLTMGQAKFAFNDEIAEFGQELSGSWKWWKAEKKPLDKQKALFELVDAIHFGMLLVLFRNDLSAVLNRVLDPNGPECDMYGQVSDPLNYFLRSVQRFYSALEFDQLDASITGLINVIETGGKLLDLEPGEVYAAYAAKNKLNHLRVEGGDKYGLYDRSKETV